MMSWGQAHGCGGGHAGVRGCAGAAHRLQTAALAEGAPRAQGYRWELGRRNADDVCAFRGGARPSLFVWVAELWSGRGAEPEGAGAGRTHPWEPLDSPKKSWMLMAAWRAPRAYA